MKTKFATPIASLFLLLVLLWSHLSQLPSFTSGPVSLEEFSSERALSHISEMSRSAHYTGSENHAIVANYLKDELRQLGLEVSSQQGYTLTEWGNLTNSHNIMARIKGSGSGKALLLLSHYDSAPHSFSKGAADDASGVAVILESVRAFLHKKAAHRNDIIILFTDAEELGLNGAALFAKQHPWVKDVGLALNFEARGTSGPGYMLMEVTDGNAALVNAFADAGVSRPAANSLMYSVYKMMPNDTDLTVFREQAKVQGLNFAFIDSHFNYHTAQDDTAHLNPNTLTHQGDYLVPLLAHFGNTNLETLSSDADQVYFTLPYSFFHYPFAWNHMLWGVAVFLFAFLVFVGFGKRVLNGRAVGKGYLLFLLTVALSGGIVFLLWKTVLGIYPEYGEILQGFTYNGHWYLAAFLMLSLGICFLMYSRSQQESRFGNYVVAPLSFWILICLGLNLYLPGAGFLCIPLLFSLIMFGYFILTQRVSLPLFTLLSLPVLLIIFPFLIMFPIGLGLKLLAGSAVLLALSFGLLLPLFGQFRMKALTGSLFLAGAIGLLVVAHLKSGFSEGEAKPNSLVFLYDVEKDQSYWATYDKVLDDWSRTYLGSDPKPADRMNSLPLFSKYGTKFSYQTDAMNRNLEEPQIVFEKDTTYAGKRHLAIRISPGRKVNRYDIFASVNTRIYDLRTNGVAGLGRKPGLFERSDKKLLSYYVVGNEPLLLEFSVENNQPLDMELIESSFDLMNNPAFDMRKRSKEMMPKPFILTDAVMIRKKIRNEGRRGNTISPQRSFLIHETASDTIQDPDADNDYLDPVAKPATTTTQANGPK